MNKKSFFSVMLVVLFLAAGTSKVYCQAEYTSNYFVSGKTTCAIPDRIDESTLTNQDKEELEDVEGEYEYCEEDEEYDFSFYAELFKLDKTTLMFVLQMMMEGSTVYEKDGFVIAVMEEDGDTIEMGIHLDSLIFESRYFVAGNGNPFFDEAGNHLWGFFRVDFKEIGGYIILGKVTQVGYDILPSGIPYETTNVESYLYYELIDENDSTVVKYGNEELYNDCMGYTGIKEIQQTADIKIYPNPANGRVTLSLPSYMTEDEVVNVEIFNILGKTVLSHHASGNQIDMDIHSLPAGIYVVRCVKDDKVISKRFVKQ